jgi:flavorubredoxin
MNIKWWDFEIPLLEAKYEKEKNLTWTESTSQSLDLEDLSIEKRSKKKYNTFLVFHSGNIIMSGMTEKTMQNDYEMFSNLLKKWKNTIEEKILEN